MTSTVISIIALCITGAGILVQLGRLLTQVEGIGTTLREQRDEQVRHRESIEALRRSDAARDRDHAHLIDHVDTIDDRVVRIEARLDGAPPRR
jgi:hypothetical protein